jgi:CDP-diacylglycerol pyrophosphatase
MADSSDGGISRRRFLITSSLLSVGAPAAGTSSWRARADPDITPPFVPPSDCGNVKDTDELWEAVKDATPQKPHPNEAVVIPDPNKLFGYAVKNGDTKQVSGKYNLLVIPAPVSTTSTTKVADARVTGVECAKIWQSNALNLWDYAWREAGTRFKGADVMLGVNSYHGRTHNQLHIHLTGLQQQARNTLNNDLKGKIKTDLSGWNNSMFSVMGHVYRIVQVNDLTSNVFTLVKDHISQDDMFQQAIAVVSAPGKGFYILNTQGKPDKGEREHNPELRIGNDFGTESIDSLIYRG